MKIRIGLKTSPGGTYYAIKGGSYNTNDRALFDAIDRYCMMLTISHRCNKSLLKGWSDAFAEPWIKLQGAG